jgi:hypothetical protein
LAPINLFCSLNRVEAVASERRSFLRKRSIAFSAQRYISQLSDEGLTERAIDNRDRSIRLMSHPIFRIAEAFLES